LLALAQVADEADERCCGGRCHYHLHILLCCYPAKAFTHQRVLNLTAKMADLSGD
jgi:hypothetical protein